jgi:hypothetical protein
LLVHSEKDERHRGSDKTAANNVVAFDENGEQIGIVFETATPFDTPRLMTELVNWCSNAMETGAFYCPKIWVPKARRIDGRVPQLVLLRQLSRAGWRHSATAALAGRYRRRPVARWSI